MGTKVSYAGRPFDKAIEAQRYHAVIAAQLRPFGYSGPTTIREHLLTARATGAPGEEFRYENGNVETLAEVLRRVTGLTTSALLSDLLWARIGAEEDAYYVWTATGWKQPAEASARQHAMWPGSVRCCAAAERSGISRWFRRKWPARSPAACPTATPAGCASRPRPRLTGHALLPRPVVGLERLLRLLYGQWHPRPAAFVSPGTDLVIVHFGSQVMSPAVPPVPLVQAFVRIGEHLNS